MVLFALSIVHYVNLFSVFIYPLLLSDVQIHTFKHNQRFPLVKPEYEGSDGFGDALDDSNLERMVGLWIDAFGREGGMKLILASASPRRQQLLKGMGFQFETMSLEVDEAIDSTIVPDLAAIILSERKSKSIPDNLADSHTLFITADTIVAHEGHILGKPVDREDALRMIGDMSDTRHEVFTGVTLRMADRISSFVVKSDVWFSPLSEQEIAYYVDEYKPFDKAGAYGIQEWIGYIAIERIEGSFYNVMGLPTHALYQEIKSFLGV